MDYKDVIAFLDKEEDKEDTTNERTKLSEDEIEKIKNKYKNVPEDYLDYLRYVGHGNFRECHFTVFPLLTFSDLDRETELETDDENEDLVFFGDNFSGDLFGFNLEKNGNVIEYWHDSEEIYETDQTFYEYIKERMLMDDEEGNALFNKYKRKK